MSLLLIASEKSRRRGYEYFTGNKVISASRTDSASWVGTVLGSGAAKYHVTIDLEHPRKSSCDCPFAAGRSRICKHMIALYFTVFPDEAEKYRLEEERRLAEIEMEEELELQRHEAVIARLSRMSNNELVDLVSALLQALPDWQYDAFIDELLDDSEDCDDDGEFDDDREFEDD